MMNLLRDRSLALTALGAVSGLLCGCFGLDLSSKNACNDDSDCLSGVACVDGVCGGKQSASADVCDPNPCEEAHRSVCVEDDGEASCDCDEGYALEGGRCVCAEGYALQDGYCVDMDVCDPNPCDGPHRGVCSVDDASVPVDYWGEPIGYGGRPVCDCDTGYELVDDECVLDTLIEGAPGTPWDVDSPASAHLVSDPAATFECRVDGGDWEPCEEEVDLSDAGLGDHTLEARASHPEEGTVDSTPASVSWRGYTFVEGLLPPNTVWTAERSPYRVVGDIDAQSLTIGPGARVEGGFSNGETFTIKHVEGTGDFTILGTQDAPAVLRGRLWIIGASLVEYLDAERTRFESGPEVLRHSVLRGVARNDWRWDGILQIEANAFVDCELLYVPVNAALTPQVTWQYNLFINSGGIEFYQSPPSHTEFFVLNNFFRGADIAIDASRISQPPVAKHNSFIRVPDGPASIALKGVFADATENHFGTTDEAEIAQQIFDVNDLGTLEEIEFRPFLSEPHPDTPTEEEADALMARLEASAED